jgi:hypothetical protein
MTSAAAVVRVMLAKIVAAFAGGAVIGAAAAVATVAGVLSAKGPVLLSGAHFARYAAGSVLGAALLAAIGCVVGTLVRSQVGAVIVVFVWCLAIEQILAGVSRSVARFLPLLGATTMAGGDSRAGRDGRAAGRHHAGTGCRRRAHSKPRYLITAVVHQSGLTEPPLVRTVPRSGRGGWPRPPRRHRPHVNSPPGDLAHPARIWHV